MWLNKVGEELLSIPEYSEGKPAEANQIPNPGFILHQQASAGSLSWKVMWNQLTLAQAGKNTLSSEPQHISEGRQSYTMSQKLHSAGW